MIASAILAVTALERLGLGLMGLLLCLTALVLWLFPLLMCGRLWRSLTRPRRSWWMGLVILGMLVITIAFVIGVPTRSYDDRPSGWVMIRRFGLTGWLEFREPVMPGDPLPDDAVRISVVGILALAPTILALAWLARWLHRELPKMYRRPDHRCDECDYDLTAIRSPVCPECGEPIG